MSTRKIIRQILIGAAFAINATAITTLGQQQVNATLTPQQADQINTKIKKLDEKLTADMAVTKQKFEDIDQQINDLEGKVKGLDQAVKVEIPQLKTAIQNTTQELTETQTQLETVQNRLQQSDTVRNESVAMNVVLTEQIEQLAARLEELEGQQNN